MAVGVGPQIVAVGDQAADRSRELGRPVEIPREEEAGFDAFLGEDPADGLAAVGEGAAGEDKRQPPEGGVAADDRPPVQGEVPAGTSGRSRAAPTGDSKQKNEQNRDQASRSRRRKQIHFSACWTFQPRIFTAGISPSRSSVVKTPEIRRVSFGSSVT